MIFPWPWFYFLSPPRPDPEETRTQWLWEKAGLSNIAICSLELCMSFYA